MGSWRFEITVVSAENLPDIRRLGRMKVYAVVSLNREYETMRETTVDKYGNTNPRWNFPFVYSFNGSYLRQPGLDVVVDLFCERTLGDKLVGQVIIPVKSLFDRGLRSQRSLSYPISGTRYAKLNILYCFEETAKPPRRRTASWEDGDGLDILVRGLSLMTGDFSSLVN
ncbi:protein SRC2 [Salvia divinorum]|uniref:Protein SRC2 n=1 Tax=Salvia divinorum TaxID=28513 RepID=A0ABD1GIP5_SALDI